jgi:predicted transport protein
VCLPTVAIDDYFAARPAGERAIFDAVVGHLLAVDSDIDVEAATVGILVKKRRTFVELRPKTRWVELSIMLTRPIDDRRVSKRIVVSRTRFAYFFRLRSAADVDDDLRELLTESCLQF